LDATSFEYIARKRVSLRPASSLAWHETEHESRQMRAVRRAEAVGIGQRVEARDRFVLGREDVSEPLPNLHGRRHGRCATAKGGPRQAKAPTPLEFSSSNMRISRR
jgi:hypothetical protein